jgi:hypothetical protein
MPKVKSGRTGPLYASANDMDNSNPVVGSSSADYLSTLSNKNQYTAPDAAQNMVNDI